ncbi:MAG: trypsin-like peptidase domain-containing protein, partial [Dongiaceae bacterium]
MRWVSPWIALGLAAALVIVLLRPAKNDASVAASAAPSDVTPPEAAPAGGPAPTPAPTAPSPASYADAVDRAAPAVVNISTERRVVVPNVAALPPQLGQLFGEVWPDYRERVERSLGSGVIYDAAGHVVTNYHVIAQASQINVEHRDGRAAAATLVGVDPDTDLAVLK